MAKPINTINHNKEKEMRKYIVEAPNPKIGQQVSSGGIRENGKLRSQFKNPVPYEEPSYNTNQEIGLYILDMIWQEFGEPVFRSGLRKLGNTIINKLEFSTTHTTRRIHVQEPSIINVPTDEIKTIK